jgi:hypothetical protein
VSVRRRGNGLTAASYVLLLDIDPRLAERLLVSLATAGIAAYTTPATGRLGPLLESHPPSRPLEAVHVDSTCRPAARRVLETTMPDVTAGLPSVEEEDLFAALVAGWDEEPLTRDWPSLEDLGDPGDGAATPPAPTAEPSDSPPRRRRTDPSAAPLAEDETTREAGDESSPGQAGPTLEKAPRSPDDAAGTGRADGTDQPGEAGQAAPGDAADLDEQDDPTDHYVPPALPPLPPSHPVTKWGLVALGLGLLLLIFPTLLGLEHTTGVDFVGVLCILGAVGLLVSRLSTRSTGEYEGPDDGAVV